MVSDDIAISVRNLTKTYRLFAHPGDRIKQAMTFGLRKYHKEFTVWRFDLTKFTGDTRQLDIPFLPLFDKPLEI